MGGHQGDVRVCLMKFFEHGEGLGVGLHVLKKDPHNGVGDEPFRHRANVPERVGHQKDGAFRGLQQGAMLASCVAGKGEQHHAAIGEQVVSFPQDVVGNLGGGFRDKPGL